MSPLLRVASVLLALGALGFFIAAVVWGYDAALTPGPNNEAVDAGFLSAGLCALLGWGSVVAWGVAEDTW